MIVTLAVLSLYWLRRSTRDAQLFRVGFRSSYMAWLALGCVFMLLGDVFEKQFFDTDSNLFWEEWAELVGYVCFLIPPLLRKRLSVPSCRQREAVCDGGEDLCEAMVRVGQQLVHRV